MVVLYPLLASFSKTTIALVKQMKLSMASTVLQQRHGQTEVENQRCRKHNKGKTERTGNASTQQLQQRSERVMDLNYTNKSAQRLRKNSCNNERTVKLTAWGSHGIAITGRFYKQVTQTFVRNYTAIIYSALRVSQISFPKILSSRIVINLTDKELAQNKGVLASSFCSYLDK